MESMSLLPQADTVARQCAGCGSAAAARGIAAVLCTEPAMATTDVDCQQHSRRMGRCTAGSCAGRR